MPSNESDGKVILNDVDGLIVTILGPERIPAVGNSSGEASSLAFGAASAETSNFDSIFAEVPAWLAAVIVNVVAPTSLARGVPDSVRVLSSNDNQDGLDVREYCNDPESDEKLVAAN